MSIEGEPSADLIAQISQEIYSSNVLHVAIKQLHLVDFEVRVVVLMPVFKLGIVIINTRAQS